MWDIVVAGFHVFFSFISLAELLYVLRRAYLSQATGILFIAMMTNLLAAIFSELL